MKDAEHPVLPAAVAAHRASSPFCAAWAHLRALEPATPFWGMLAGGLAAYGAWEFSADTTRRSADRPATSRRRSKPMSKLLVKPKARTRPRQPCHARKRRLDLCRLRPASRWSRARACRRRPASARSAWCFVTGKGKVVGRRRGSRLARRAHDARSRASRGRSTCRRDRTGRSTADTDARARRLLGAGPRRRPAGARDRARRASARRRAARAPTRATSPTSCRRTSRRIRCWSSR